MALENTTGNGSYNLFQGRNIKRGAKGEQVGKIQTALNQVYANNPNVTPLDVDNDFGGETKKRVKKFQEDFGLKQGHDGIVGKETGPKLGVMAGYMANAPKATDESNFAMPNPNEGQQGPVIQVDPNDFGKIQQAAAPQKEQPKKTPEQDGIDTMKNLFTTPEQEEKLRRASVARRGILAIGDALRHLGNIYYTSKGAPAQKFNNPVAEEEARYKEAKKERDADNAKVLSYQQMKAKQEEDKRRWEAEFGLKGANLERQIAADRAAQKRHADELAERQRQYDTTYNFNVQKAADDRAHKEGQLKEMIRSHKRMEGIQGYQARTGRMRAEADIENMKAGWDKPLTTPDGRSITAPAKKRDKGQIIQMHKLLSGMGVIKDQNITANDYTSAIRNIGKSTSGKTDKYAEIERSVLDALATDQRAGDLASERFNWTYGDAPAGYVPENVRAPQESNGLFSAPWNNGGRQTISGFGGSGTGGGRQKIQGFGGN